MAVPVSSSDAPRTPRPLQGGEWYAARASLAARRSARFTRLWAIVLGPLAAIAFAIPFLTTGPDAAARARFERTVAETLRTAQRVTQGERSVVSAESLLVAARTTPAAARTAIPRPVATVATRAAGAPRDPQTAALDAAIREARRLRTAAAWLAVAEEPVLNAGPRTRALADTLARLAQQRDALPTGPQREQQLAVLTQRIGRLGYTILAIADNRLSELTGAPSAPAREAAVVVAIRPPDSSNAGDSRADTVALVTALTGARDTLVRARRAHDSLGALARELEATAASGEGSRLVAASPGILLTVLLLGGLLLKFGTALRHEMRAPTLATAHEAERSSGSPVVAIVREALIDGPARYRPSGVDPFRMLYLGLTATGTRARTAIITGADPVIAAAVAGRLAIAAAADHRATLVVDLDPAQIALSRTFRERPEPGLTDALAGAFKWREVARPVGSSDGLPITLIPAGTERDDLPEGEELSRAREEFTRFRSAHELTILLASPQQIARALSLVETTPLVHCATTGESSVAGFAAESAELRAAGHRVHGVVLWEANRPQLPSRAELAAHLSKMKGRTPGGSFEAVNRAVSPKNTRQK